MCIFVYVYSCHGGVIGEFHKIYELQGLNSKLSIIKAEKTQDVSDT